MPNTSPHSNPLCSKYIYLAVQLWLQLLFAVGLATGLAPAGVVGPEPSEIVGRRMPSRAPGRLLQAVRGGR